MLIPKDLHCARIAQNGCFSFMFKGLRVPRRRDRVSRLTTSRGNRPSVPEYDYTYGLLKVNGDFSGDQWMCLAVACHSGEDPINSLSAIRS